MKLRQAITLIFIAAPFLAGCAVQPDRLWVKSPDWSRAKLIGFTRVGDPVPVAQDDEGSAYVFYISSRDDRPVLQVVSFSPDGSLRWEQSVPEVELFLPAEPQAIWDGDELEIFWINDYQVYGASLGKDGAWRDEPRRLIADHTVDQLVSATDSSGHVSLWFSGTHEHPGVYAFNDPLADADVYTIDSLGTDPDLAFDETGQLHALWVRNPEQPGGNQFVYGVYPEGDLESGQASTVTSPSVYGTSALEGPFLGIDDENAYIFWSVIFYSGPEAGTVKSQYVHLPRGGTSSISTPRSLSVPWSHDLDYVDVEGGSIESGRRVPLETGFSGGGTYIVQINPDQGTQDELAISFQARLGYLMRKVQSQVALVYLDEGTISGYQQLSFTQPHSSTPFLSSDSPGYLYMTWLEKGDLPGWAVYFASTAPGFVQGFGGTSVDDIARTSIEVSFGLAIGALLIPVAIAWVLTSSLVLQFAIRISEWISPESTWGRSIAVILALATLWVSKLGILPGITSYVPFSAWIPFLPSSLSLPLRIATPLIILGLAIAGALWFTRKYERKPIFEFFFAYCIIDGILTMAVYGVLIIAAF